MTLPSTCHSPASRRGAFTLIEVMISMALVLGLILGINAVFKMAADTVGTGQGVSAKMRDARAAQSVIYNETSHMVVSGSEFRFLILDARTQLAFRDVRDKENDHDYDPVADITPAALNNHVRTTDIDGNNTDGEAGIPGEVICPASVNDRAHRVDTLSFFAKDLYRRQTGNNNVYVDNMASQDAWITYGHGRVFDQSGDTNLDDDKNHFPLPGAAPTTTNPNPKNFYATDWCLLRTAMLVAAPNVDVVSTTPLDGIVDNVTPPIPPTARQFFWATEPGGGPVLKDLPPLGRNTTANDSTQKLGTAGDLTISSGRYDLLPKGMKIQSRDYNDLRDILEDYIERTHYYLGGTQGTPGLDDDWFDILPSSASTDPSGSGLPGRFRCNPYPSRPMSPGKATLVSPILLTNCTQFIVEYAGDYLTQETAPGTTYGDIKKIGPDGVIDFFVEQAALAGKTVPVQRVRWYGFPRDVNGDGEILGCSGATVGNGSKHHELVDVIPLRDVILSFDYKFYEDISTKKANWDQVRFERNVFTKDPNLDVTRTTLPPQNVYMRVATGISNVTPNARYTCAWGPDDGNKPSMIRIIFRVDDPNGRLADGQTSEFVIKLP